MQSRARDQVSSVERIYTDRLQMLKERQLFLLEQGKGGDSEARLLFVISLWIFGVINFVYRVAAALQPPSLSSERLYTVQQQRDREVGGDCVLVGCMLAGVFKLFLMCLVCSY